MMGKTMARRLVHWRLLNCSKRRLEDYKPLFSKSHEGNTSEIKTKISKFCLPLPPTIRAGVPTIQEDTKNFKIVNKSEKE